MPDETHTQFSAATAGAEEAIRDWWYSDRRQPMTSKEAAKSLIWYLAKCGMKIIRDEPQPSAGRVQAVINEMIAVAACDDDGNLPEWTSENRATIDQWQTRLSAALLQDQGT